MVAEGFRRQHRPPVRLKNEYFKRGYPWVQQLLSGQLCRDFRLDFLPVLRSFSGRLLGFGPQATLCCIDAGLNKLEASQDCAIASV